MSSNTDRLSAALAGRYRIERELGADGMATVYLAHDLKHDRQVALKLLRPELAAVLGAERFVQEIKTTAALQHPHILPLFDSGTSDGFLFYVMPFIDGETLRDKLNRETQLGVDEAVRIAREVADALDYAHRHGVIHRDIKPENILLHDGRPMVADFGIALAVSAAAGGRMTETGLSLGTPHYMSPEQATAEKEITARSDVYSLGSVLYEMLAGNPPHTGASAQQIIMKIITEAAAPVTQLRKSVPPNVAAAVARAIEKLPADRFESAKAFSDALGNPGFTTADATGQPPVATHLAARSRMTLAGWGIATVLAVALIAQWARGRSGISPTQAPSLRFTLSMGSPATGSSGIDISPDGRLIVQPYGSGRPGGLTLTLRYLETLETTVLPGTPGGNPRFSPDGRWILYSQETRLRKVPVGGGTSIDISNACSASDWFDNTALVCETLNWGLGRVSASGGPMDVLTTPDTSTGEIGLWSPTVLPGGHAVLFTSYRRPASRIEAFDMRTRKRVVLVENAVMGRYARSGHLLFARDSTLFAIRFDPGTLRTSGAAVPVLEDLEVRMSDAKAGYAISDNGTLVATRHSQWQSPRRVVWVDRAGREQPAIANAGVYAFPRLSPDGSKILVTVTTGHRDLWSYDLTRGLLTQVTRASASAFRGIWMPEGRSVLFTNETPAYDLYRVPLDGSAPPTAVIANVMDKYASSVSPDGALLAYEQSSAGVRSIVVAPVAATGKSWTVGDAAVGAFQPSFHRMDVGSNTRRAGFMQGATLFFAKLMVLAQQFRYRPATMTWIRGGRRGGVKSHFAAQAMSLPWTSMPPLVARGRSGRCSAALTHSALITQWM